MDEKNIIVDIYKNKYKKEKILNENNKECLICYKKMNNNTIILINNYCNCFFAILLCEKCFLNWLLITNRCFVCREILYDVNDNDKDAIKIYNEFGENLGIVLSHIINLIDPQIINELNLSSYFSEKSLAIRAPNEKPTK